MIVYGTKSKELLKETLPDKCENCGSQLSIDMYVFEKYVHVFWIPFFPIGKTGISQCNHCKQILKSNEMPSALRSSYENLKSQARTPIWMFSGIALIALAITIGIIADKKNDEQNQKIILAPKVGDIFKVKTKDDKYTLFKVSEVLKDSVYILINNYETDMSSGLDDLKAKDYFDVLLGYSKKELKEMLEKGEIIDIDRK